MSHRQGRKSAVGKSGGDKGNSNLQDRFREMGAQEQLIEQKKREIESKMQEKQRKEHEEMFNKMQAKLLAAKKAEQSRSRYCVVNGSSLLLLYPWLVPSSGVAGVDDYLLSPFRPVCCVDSRCWSVLSW